VTALSSARGGEESASIRERVTNARARQGQRATPGVEATNATLSPRDLERVCALPAEAKKLLVRAVEMLGLSARAYSKVLRVARTIADLEGAEDVTVPHVAEAIQYRALDRERAEARPAA
jgi:magnesium chelatase family protein